MSLVEHVGVEHRDIAVDLRVALDVHKGEDVARGRAVPFYLAQGKVSSTQLTTCLSRWWDSRADRCRPLEPRRVFTTLGPKLELNNTRTCDWRKRAYRQTIWGSSPHINNQATFRCEPAGARFGSFAECAGLLVHKDDSKNIRGKMLPRTDCDQPST